MSTPTDGTLQAWRRTRGLSLAKAAAELGISGANAAETLRRYESGVVWPRPEILGRIVAAGGGDITVEAMLAVRIRRGRHAPDEVPRPVLETASADLGNDGDHRDSS